MGQGIPRPFLGSGPRERQRDRDTRRHRTHRCRNRRTETKTESCELSWANLRERGTDEVTSQGPAKLFHLCQGLSPRLKLRSWKLIIVLSRIISRCQDIELTPAEPRLQLRASSAEIAKNHLTELSCSLAETILPIFVWSLVQICVPEQNLC